jgi:hypothetical protein
VRAGATTDKTQAFKQLQRETAYLRKVAHVVFRADPAKRKQFVSTVVRHAPKPRKRAPTVTPTG